MGWWPCYPHQLTAFFCTDTEENVCKPWPGESKLKLWLIFSSQESRTEFCDVWIREITFHKGPRNTFIILLVPCSPSNTGVTKSHRLRRAGCTGFGDCLGIPVSGEEKNKRHFPSYQHRMNAVADCKPPCCFAVWCFEWAFTQVFLLFKVWTVVKFFLKVRMVRSLSLEDGRVLHTEIQSAVCNCCLSCWARFLLFVFYAKPECWIMSHSCDFLGPLNCREDLKSLVRRWVLPANLHSISLLPVFSPHSLTPRPDKKKFIWTLVIISVWENSQSVKLSKWNSEKSRASRDLKGQKGSTKKMLVFIMVIVMKPSWKSPDKGLSYCTIKCFLPPGFTSNFTELIREPGSHSAVFWPVGKLAKPWDFCHSGISGSRSWEGKELEGLKKQTACCLRVGSVWVGNTTFLLLETLAAGGWVSSPTGWRLCWLGPAASCRR